MSTDGFPSLREHRENMWPRATPSQRPSPQPSAHPSRAPSIIIPDGPPPQTRRRANLNQTPQKAVDQFWSGFTSKHPGMAYTILPDNFYAKRAAAHASLSTTSSSLQTPAAVFAPAAAFGKEEESKVAQNAVASYEEAREACIKKVEKIVKECTRLNAKYRDPHFDIEADFKRWLRWGSPPDCLMGLADTNTELKPMSVKRVEDIFDQPQFFVDGATATDVRQGKEGDCWLMAALCTLSNKPQLIDRVCVARNEKVGVYGFVFHRDGEWISEVIDDKLYLIKEDYDEALLERNKWLELQNRTSPEEEYRTVMQTGSRALYFAQCSDPNETWLPLLEKAFAKAHGDYSALESGFVGEGIEDLTGGVTTELFGTDILDKDKFWREELMNVNKQFLFGCGQMGGKYGQRKGILEKHAYSIMEAREVNGERLLKLRNPWGNSEWTGAWSDGSVEWTPEWMKILDHRFGDDGIFWISYKDLLRNYQHFDRTRLFGPEWTVTQQWTSFNVPWTVDYLDTKFKVSLAKASHVVIVLSQLDDRYFRGLEGQYEFHLQFRVHAEGEEDYIVRSNSTYYMRRSVSTELQLEAGNYFILLKIAAKRYPNDPTPEDIVRKTCHTRREKLLTIGLGYDLAHAKGGFRGLEKRQKQRERDERRQRRRDTAKKMYEGRIRQHKKQKLKKIKMDMRLHEKQRQKLEREAERQRAAAEAAAQDAQNSGNIEKGLENFRFTEKRTTAEPDPLGITNGVHGSNGDLPTPPSTGGPRTMTYPTTSPSLNGLSASPRPATPPTSMSVLNHRDSLSATQMQRQGRRDTLQQRPLRRGTSPVPGIRIQRPSITEATARGKSITLSDISDDDLSWDSELDAPDNTDSDADDADDDGDAHSDAHFGGGFDHNGFGGAASNGFLGPHDEDEDHEDDEDAPPDPWNAVCVAGLRVFCEDPLREAKVSIDVVRPGDPSSPSSVHAFNKGVGQRRLDWDDSAADAARTLRRTMLLEGGMGEGPAHLEPSVRRGSMGG